MAIILRILFQNVKQVAMISNTYSSNLQIKVFFLWLRGRLLGGEIAIIYFNFKSARALNGENMELETKWDHGFSDNYIITSEIPGRRAAKISGGK